ncbi:hypothetical protein K438DRAFT_81013 [Mycena galopus ATCC 62051]|nr:hypothetical protein K438DRAFT_81013 [Mycena galopus ATCC 62051]
MRACVIFSRAILTPTSRQPASPASEATCCIFLIRHPPPLCCSTDTTTPLPPSAQHDPRHHRQRALHQHPRRLPGHHGLPPLGPQNLRHASILCV